MPATPRGRAAGPFLSPDGRRIAVIVADTSDPASIARSTTFYVMNADGSGLQALATLPGIADLMAWSYDGREIAVTHQGLAPRPLPPGYSRDANIVVLNVVTGAAQQITHHGERRYIDEGASWSPDGHIYFHSSRDGEVEIYRMNADGSDVRRVTK